MNTIRKRLLSLFLCFVLIAGMLPVGAFATEAGETATPETTEVTETPTQTASETEELSESVETSEEESEQTDTSKKDEKEAEKAEKKEEKPAEKEAKEEEKETESSIEPSSEATEPSSEATEPSSEATEPSSEPTEPVVIPVTGITLDQTALEVGVGELPMTLTATILPENATDKTVTWESSEPGVVSVENGVLTFGYMGEAVITATVGGFSASCTVKVGEGESTAYADPDTIYVLAGGDFQAGDNGQEDHYYSRINMGNILDEIAGTYSTMNGFLFVGDYDGDSHNDANAATGIAAMMEEVSERFDTLNHANSVLIEGNHESGNVSGIDPTGGYEFDGYAVYAINETDYCEKQTGKGTQIQTVANNLEAWLNNKLGEGYDAPIFVITHVPLAYGTRTYTNGDGLYAKYVFDVLNSAAEDGLNIIFLHGHDHAYGADNYLGGEAIYLPEGDKINICVPGDKASWTEETLNFTYMNAGYVGYYNENYYNVNLYEAEKLTMTVFKIKGNQVTVERYSKDGLYNLKSAGREGFYSNASTCANIGLSYNTAVYASPQTISLSDVETGGTNGGSVGVTPEVEDDVTTSGNEWITITAPTGGTTTYNYTWDTDGMDTDTGYLIVNGTTTTVLENNSTSGVKTATITSNAGSTATASTQDYEWKIDNSKHIYTTIDGTTYYLQGSYSWSWVGSSASLTLTTNTNNATAWNISNNKGTYTISANLGSNWNSATCYLTTSGISTDEGTVRLYYADGETTTGGTAGLYGMLDGTLTANVPYGTSSDDALAAVKNAVAIKYATAADYSDMQEYPDDGKGMTWTLDPNYDPNDPGDYAVTIAYNGVTLGTAEVVVNTTTKYYTAEGNGLYIVDMNTSEANALAAVKAGITVYSADDADGTNRQTIDDSKVTWNWVDTYNGADSGPYTVEILYNGTSLGTVEVKVDVQYETGIETDWTYIGETAGSGGTTTVTYKLDTNGIDTGSSNKYIIVARNQAYLLDAGSAVPVTISSDGQTATTTTRDYEYYFTGSTSGLITRDGNNTLYQQNWGIHVGNISDSNLDMFVNNGNGYYRLYDGDGTDRSLYYNGSSWTVTSSDHTNSTYSVRLYKYDSEETVGGTPGGPVYALIEGPTRYTVTQGSSATKALSAVKNGITGYTATDATGTGKTELADSDLTWKWKNTFNGNVTGSYWVEISYQGKVLGTVEVQVVPGVVNNYPEYPDEGAVKVNKTATGIDFQSSGIAQVEVSASGVPVKKGADVIVMLDTSSSMTNTNYLINGVTRAAVLEESLKNLITQFKTPGDDGEPLDIRVAIADFNGFYESGSGTPYDRDLNDTLSDEIYYTANSEAKVYTGTGDLSAGAFIPAEDLAATYTLNYTSGTNYDYAMDAIYQLGTAIQEANGSEDRDLFVIFMSDGAAMQWNYYHSNGRSTDWQYWITGKWDADTVSTQLQCTEHAYYYADDVDGDGYVNEHRMADAIKGDPNETYEVIRKTDTLGTAVSGYENLYKVPGLGATMFAIAFDPQTDQNTPPEAMEESIKTIASVQTGTTQYYYRVETANELSSAFTAIGSEIAYAADNARFVDQMGSNFNLQMQSASYTAVENGTETKKTLTPKIEIISYDIWTRQEYLDNKCTEDQIGDRKGTYSVLETVTFSADGKRAFSDQINNGTTNILADGTQEGYVKGVIYAKTFLYNTNTTEVAVDGVNIPTGKNSADLTTGSTNVLPKETFYWKMGTVQTSELAMRYYVYLDGSMEGTREAGSYPTNNFATLYYDNYLGNPCLKDTVSPVMAWKSANVSYAFYLVNENGEIIVNQTTGQTGTFANKIAVTNPVVYEEILLNNTDQVQALNVAAISDDVLPKYYELYDENAVYTVTINSNSTGKWEITKGDTVTAESTYVTNFDTQIQYSNALTNETVGHDYTHTVVWFAVVWKLQAHPDSVVVDYGLPVDISVLSNDMFGENGRLAGVGAYSEGIENTTAGASLENGFGADYTGTYGTAKADTSTGKVRYTLNSMQMPTYEKFAYAVNYTGSENTGYYYDTITVIPATTIYYEDSFVRFNDLTWQQKEGGNAWEGSWTVQNTSNRWMQVGNTVEGVQDEDRPGKYSLTDANNIYGYDNVNKSMSTYSMGSAMKATVDYDNGAQASFDFMGTGFDVISMTDSTTGTIWVKVYPYNEDGTLGEIAKNFVVDTYYGYNHGLYNVTYTYTNGEWIKTIGTEVTTESATAIAATFPENPVENATVTAIEDLWVLDPNAAEHIWQVPVMKIDGLTYGKYKGVIEAVYEPAFDHVDGSTSGSYDFYLDAIRIYDPANDGAQDNDTVIEDAYKADGESWPSYVELRNGLISEGTLGNAATDTEIEGLVFIDGDETVGDAQISDYISYGPNNEVYLAPGQRVAFRLSLPENAANVHIGIKSADGNIGTYSITNIAQEADTENNVAAGQWYNAKTATMDTATDMYYDLTEWKNDIIVISNTGNREDRNTSGIISLTNIKFTYTADPGENEAGIYVTPKIAMLTLRSLNAPVEEEIPEETTPSETMPGETVPETTEPDVTEPEETEPDETKPDKESEKIQKEIEKAMKKAAKELQKAAEKAAKALSKLFGNWF